MDKVYALNIDRLYDKTILNCQSCAWYSVDFAHNFLQPSTLRYTCSALSLTSQINKAALQKYENIIWKTPQKREAKPTDV